MKIEFKVVSKYPNSNVIKGTIFNKKSKTINTLLVDGTILPRKPYDVEERDGSVYNHTLKMREPNPKQEGTHIYTETFTFYTDADADKIQDGHLKQKNTFTAKFYEFLKMHDHVIVRNDQGEDVNTNNIHSAFELIDITVQNAKEAEKHKLIIEAGDIIKNVYDSDKKAFRDFCYAYGIPMVQLYTDEILFNMVMQKIHTNPHFFFEIYNNKQRDIITLIELGLNKDIGTESAPKKALTINGNSYYMEGDLLAVGKQELLEVLMTDVARRRILETLVGYTVTTHKSLDSKEEQEYIPFAEETKKEMRISALEESKFQASIRGKFSKLSKIKTKEDFEASLQEVKEFILSKPEFMHSWGLNELKSYIERHHFAEKFKNVKILEDNLNKLGETPKFES